MRACHALGCQPHALRRGGLFLRSPHKGAAAMASRAAIAATDGFTTVNRTCEVPFRQQASDYIAVYDHWA
jgi:hypothetical protein